MFSMKHFIEKQTEPKPIAKIHMTKIGFSDPKKIILNSDFI